MLIAAPSLLAWFEMECCGPFKRSSRDLTLLFLGLGSVAYIVFFSDTYFNSFTQTWLAYLVFPIAVWIAIRWGRCLGASVRRIRSLPSWP